MPLKKIFLEEKINKVKDFFFISSTLKDKPLNLWHEINKSVRQSPPLFFCFIFPIFHLTTQLYALVHV